MEASEPDTSGSGAPRRVVIASKNPDKIAEIEAVLTRVGVVDEIVDGLVWEDIEETGATLADNAVLKAAEVCRVTGLAAIADDTGLEVDALDGAPGVFTARYAGPDASYADNVEALLAALDGVMERSARFRTVMAYVDPDGVVVLADATLEGSITRAPRGVAGFGYDPIFLVDDRTLAEMPRDEKNRISHRGKAILALAERLSG